MAVGQFVNRFHSLSGKTIGEKLKDLNQLISDLKSGCSQHEIDHFIAEVKPGNNFEKLLKGRLIDSFKKSQDLLSVLRSEDRLFIKQVLCCNWFFEGSSADFPTCEFFITDVFPNTSFNTRNDIIHLLSMHLRDNYVAEQFFTAVRKEYGIKQARPLLCACSTHFIQSVLNVDDALVKFTEREVSRLVKKYPDLVKVNIMKKCFAAYLSKILELFVDVNVKIFIELIEMLDSHVDPKIGRRGSKKIIRCNPAAVIKSAVKYIKILKVVHLHQYFTAEDFRQFYLALFPKSNEGDDKCFFQDNGNLYSVVEVLTPKKRLEMILTCFEKVYGEKLLTQTHLVGEKLLLLLPSDQREICAQQKMDMCVDDEDGKSTWICYQTIEKSVPVLKKLLMGASDLKSRYHLISCLIRTCKINEDFEALDSVCKHLVSRYRNANFPLRNRILNELDSNFDLLKLEDRHWTSILEVIKIIFLNEEHHNRSWCVRDILAKSIHYKLNSHSDICEQIDMLILVQASECYWTSGWVITREEPKYQQVIFEAFGERIPHVRRLKVPLTKLVISLLEAVSVWNRDNKLFQSSLCKFSWAVECLREIVNTDLDGNKNSVIEFLMYDLETKQLVCPEHVYEDDVKKDVMYYLKMDTEKFIHNAEEELKFLLNKNIDNYKHLFRVWNVRSCTQVKEVVVQICSRIVANDEETCKPENAIFVLSFLMDAESFAHFIKPFHPITEKINPADANTAKMLPLMKTSAMCLKNVNPWNDYSSITQFCKGDYLQYVIGSLISVCYNTMQRKVVPFLEGLTNSPVSVKKHAVRLSFSIISRPQCLPLLNNLWCADKNPATREVLLALVWRAFLVEPTSDGFALLKYCLKSLRVDDTNMFNKLADDAHIPDDYKAEYMELCWDMLHDLLQQGGKTKPLISDLLLRFEVVIDLLPSCFCDRVIKQYLREGSLHKDACIGFGATYILKCHTQDVLEERFKLISSLLKNLIEHSASGRKDIAQFIRHVCTQVLVSKYPMVPQVLQKLLTFWPALLSPFHTFGTFILLKFTSLYFSCMPEFNLVSFGKIISEYIISVIEEYGTEAITAVSTSFDGFVNSVETWHREDCEKQETRINVITGLLTEPVPKYAYIMAAHLIPVGFADLKNLKNRYIRVIQTVFRVKDKTVCLIVNSLPIFINNLTLLDNVEQIDVQ